MIGELLKAFGFKNFTDFIDSTIYIKPLVISVPIAFFSAFAEEYLGMKWLTLAAFIILLIMEVASGIVASMYSNREKFSSIRFGRFLFKAGFWITIFFIINSFANNYDKGTVLHGLYDYLYDVIMLFVVQQYLFSLIENVGKISGHSNSLLIRLITSKVSNYIDIEGKDKQDLE